jgi:hypothetical protein
MDGHSFLILHRSIGKVNTPPARAKTGAGLESHTIATLEGVTARRSDRDVRMYGGGCTSVYETRFNAEWEIYSSR